MPSPRSHRNPGLAAGAAIAVAVLVPSAAGAHTWSVTYSELSVAPDRRVVDYRLRMSLADLGEPLGLDPGVAVTPELANANAARLDAYARARIELSGDGAACAPELVSVRVVDLDGRFAELSWRCRFPAPIGRLSLDYGLFFYLDPNHTSLLTAHLGDQRVTTPLTADGNRFSWEFDRGSAAGLAAFIASGADHIFLGYDHICFLLALLVVAAIATGPTGLHVRGLRAGLRYTAAIVTSFTAAHSLTLIAAALGWIALPSRLVESLIAASIALVCLENLYRPDPPHRWLISLGFGLVHGLGFAAMLRPLLPDDSVLLPLLAFNLGVELGQLAIVALSFPLLELAARRLGAHGYRRHVVAPASLALGLVGVAWLAQRALVLPPPW
jgi:hypothetical protein